MPFYWELHNKDTGEIVVNDYPFALNKLALLSVKKYINNNHWSNNNWYSIMPKPFNWFRQYKFNPNRTLENNGRFLIIDKQ